MERSCLFAPGLLLWLILPWATGGRLLLQGGPTQPPLPETREQAVPPTPGGLPGGALPESRPQPLSSASPPEGPRPVGQPRVWRASPQERPGEVQLFCRVPGGAADTIEWRRAGETIAVASGPSLPTGLGTWSIPATEAAHCGPYSCNASNALGWEESPPLSLASPEVSAVLGAAFRVSVSTLVLAFFCGLGMLLPICQPSKLRIRGQAWRWLNIYANAVTCLASVLALVAIALWAYAQGLPAIMIPPIILLVYVTLVMLLMLASLLFPLEVLHRSKGPALHMLWHVTPGGVLLASMICGLIIRDICQMQAKGCAGPVDLTAVIAATSGLCLVPHAAITIRYCMDLRIQEVEARISRRQKWAEIQDLLKKSLQDQDLKLPSAPQEASGAAP